MAVSLWLFSDVPRAFVPRAFESTARFAAGGLAAYLRPASGMRLTKVLKELVEHHIDEEERNVWADVKKNFSDEDRKKMNVTFLAAKGRVKV